MNLSIFISFFYFLNTVGVKRIKFVFILFKSDPVYVQLALDTYKVNLENTLNISFKIM